MQPPPEHDPNALTQPIPVTPVPPGTGAPPAGPPPHGKGPPPGGRPVPYDHRFGNRFSYLVARLLAFVLDIGGIGFVAATFLFEASDHGSILLAPHDPQSFATLVLVALGAALAFMFVCEALAGTTVGKLIFGLHVRTTRGGHAGIGRAFIRNLIRPLDLIAIGPFLALVTPRRQRLGDVLSGTVVGGSRAPAFTTILGLVLAAAIAFAQVTFAGGLSSALGVTAAAATFVPQLYNGLKQSDSPLAPFLPGMPVASPTPFPSPSPSALPEPTDTPQAEESTEPSEAPSDEATSEATDEATSEASGEPTSEPSDSQTPFSEPSPDPNATENA